MAKVRDKYFKGAKTENDTYGQFEKPKPPKFDVSKVITDFK